MTGRRVLIGLAVVALLTAGLLAAAMPAAAQPETVTLTLLNGTKLTLTVDVPPGTPLDQIKLPPVSSPIIGISVGGGGQAGTGGPGSPSGLPGAGTQGSQTVAGVGAPSVSGQGPQRPTGRKHRLPGTAGLSSGARRRAPAPRATRIRLANGLPTALNPTLSLAALGPASIGVPNFFIDNFRIPPFLLPIYQAAGVEYDVPWQVLAGVNEIETDYGRNLSTSSAGAIGWMQFLPATWKQYGVDANGDGVKDPYNPVDAIFGAARYLHAAGASTSLRQAIFAYNHAGWYVDSVLLRAKLIGGLPPELVGSVTGLTQGHFPVHAAARYADDLIEARTARTRNASVVLGGAPQRRALNIYAQPGSPVVAVQDGQIVGLGQDARLGRYIKLRDVYGNTYTYSQLGSLAPVYPTPKPRAESAALVAKDLNLSGGGDPRPNGPASAGHQAVPAAGAVTGALGGVSDAVRQATDVAGAAQRLFAHPRLPGAYQAGGRAQLNNPQAANASFDSYYTQVFGLSRGDVVLKTMRKGARVAAGTILGRIGRTDAKQAPHVQFQIRPAGKGAPLIDPKPILDGWKLLETTAIYRAADRNPFFGVDAQNPTIGQVLLESKEQLQRRVLADPNVQIYSCGRQDIQTGQIDRRILATLEFLAASGLKPSVSALKCGRALTPPSQLGLASDNATGNGVDIAAVNAIPVIGHQGPGSITDMTIRRLLTLQGIFKPREIASLMQYPATDNTLKQPAYANRIHVAFLPEFDPRSKVGRAIAAALKPRQWIKLISRLGQIANPTVAAKPSAYAIPDRPANAGH